MTTSRAPVTTGLGVLGMPGFTAYGGLRMIGKTRPAELEQMVLNSAQRDRAELLARTKIIDSRNASWSTSARSAPRAIRIPISFVRRA